MLLYKTCAGTSRIIRKALAILFQFSLYLGTFAKQFSQLKKEISDNLLRTIAQPWPKFHKTDLISMRFTNNLTKLVKKRRFTLAESFAD